MLQKKAKLYVMCGIPGSGKSTFAKEKLGHIYYVSRDAIRFSLEKENEEYFNAEKDVFSKFVAEINQCLGLGQDCVADATHLNELSRRKLLKAITAECDVVFVEMLTPVATCKIYNNNREGRARVPDDAMNRMAQAFVRPKLYEDKRITTILSILPNWRNTN